MPASASVPASSAGRSLTGSSAGRHPLAIVAGLGAAAGAGAAATRAVISFEHGIWLVAYLLLVGCLAPALISAGERRLLGASQRADEGAAIVRRQRLTIEHAQEMEPGIDGEREFARVDRRIGRRRTDGLTFDAAKGPLPILLLMPVPTPLGDASSLNVLLWQSDAILLALLVGGGLTALAPVAPGAAVVLLAVVLVIVAALGFARLRKLSRPA